MLFGHAGKVRVQIGSQTAKDGATAVHARAQDVEAADEQPGIQTWVAC
jgi:hypothetical protein